MSSRRMPDVVVFRGSTLDDPSRGWCSDSSSLRADHRGSQSVRLRQADRQLSGTGSSQRFQRGTTRLGHISKQGNSLLRFLLVEVAQATARSDCRWRNQFFHLAKRRGRKIAKVAMARRLAVRLYWMWRRGWNYEQLQSFGSHARQPGNPHGVQ